MKFRTYFFCDLSVIVDITPKQFILGNIKQGIKDVLRLVYFYKNNRETGTKLTNNWLVVTIAHAAQESLCHSKLVVVLVFLVNVLRYLNQYLHLLFVTVL